MMNALIALGLGIVVFALVVGVGIIVLQNFAGTIAQCASGFTYNTTQAKCLNATGGGATDPGNVGWTTNNTLMGYISSNLVTWIPAIIALGVGLLFIGALMGAKKQEY